MAAGGEIANGAAPELQGLRALHARLLDDRSLQFDFRSASPPPPAPGWMKALGEFLARALQGAFPALKILFWVGVGAAVLLVIFLIGRELLGVRFARRRRSAAPRMPALDLRPESWKARALLENADRLAAQGRYDQAVRLILHRGIEDIEAKRPRLVRPALTARDIAALEALPRKARTSFAEVAAIVEYSAFAGRPVGAAAYGQCRAAYQAFAFPEVWR